MKGKGRGGRLDKESDQWELVFGIQTVLLWGEASVADAFKVSPY